MPAVLFSHKGVMMDKKIVVGIVVVLVVLALVGVILAVGGFFVAKGALNSGDESPVKQVTTSSSIYASSGQETGGTVISSGDTTVSSLPADAGTGDSGSQATSDSTLCEDKDPTHRYVSHSTRYCAQTRWTCQSDEKPFTNVCGCGCKPK
ncbi:Uncharacterised protein [uncultured archaeon]|nr:Uncharacterised protein [uncultured archaeon]